jgi:hypothetical protein
MEEKIELTLEQIVKLCEHAVSVGTETAALRVLIQWATAANTEIAKLRTALAAAEADLAYRALLLQEMKHAVDYNRNSGGIGHS